MTQIPLDIERVVREVIAELKRTPTSQTSSVSSASSGSNIPLPMPTGNNELIISAKLVTLSEIDGRLTGIRRVVVNPQAVVTPAVRDALRQRDILLSRTSTSDKAIAIPLRLVVVAARTKMNPKLLAGALQGIKVECYSTNCLLDATDRLAGELAKNDALGVLLTPHTAAAMCLANRLAGVRAVLAGNTSALAADSAAVGANLLIVDPKSVGMFKLSQMAGEFCRGGVRTCPEVFRKRLV